MTERNSLRLLKSYLDEKQLHDFTAYGHFFVIARNKAVYQLKDGQSVIQWRSGGQATSFHVWATEDEYDGRMTDTYLSLLTQLLFLTSDNPKFMLDRACHGGAYWHDSRGCPPMKDYRASPNGRVPNADLS